MSFQVNLTNGTTLTTLADQTIDTTSCSGCLAWSRRQNYAPAAENRIAHMLENFANTTAPSAPVIGQLWWNSAASPSPMMMVYTGTTNGWVSGLGVNPTVTTQTNNTYNNTIATTQYVYNQLTQVLLAQLRHLWTALLLLVFQLNLRMKTMFIQQIHLALPSQIQHLLVCQPHQLR